MNSTATLISVTVQSLTTATASILQHQRLVAGRTDIGSTYLFHIKFAVDVKERQHRLPTMYWLPKLHKRPYKARFVANSSSCTTTELSKLLTSSLTAIKAKVIKYCQTVYERSGKNMFWPIKSSGEVLSKLKDIGYHSTSLSTYDFSTLYTTLPHNQIKEKLLDLIERTFYKKEG